MFKRKQLLIILMLFLSLSSMAQKTTLSFNVVAYIDEQTADYFGGKQAIQDSITSQFVKINQTFNNVAGLNNYYTFNVTAFRYYKDNANDDSTSYYSLTMPKEAAYQYRIVYDGFTSASSRYTIYYTGDNVQCVRFSYQESLELNGSMFGRVMTKTLNHEFTHTRAVPDLYAGDVDGSKNAINSLGFYAPYGSIMNNLFVESTYDPYTIYLMNQSAAAFGNNVIMANDWKANINTLYPQNINIRVKDGSGNPIQNATVKMYGTPWYTSRYPSFQISSTSPSYTYTTSSAGLVSFSGSANNPFNVNYTSDQSQYSNFLVAVTYSGQTKYAWMPFYQVANAKVNGQTDYYLDIAVNTSANVAPYLALASAGGMTVMPSQGSWVIVNAFDVDGSIANVKIYNGTSYVGDATYEPTAYRYSYAIPTTPGRYTLKAVAFDNQGASTESLPIIIDRVAQNSFPTSSITANNTTYTAPASVTITASATDSDGSLSKVELQANGVKIATLTSSPYTYNWTNVPVGNYALTALSYDNQGRRALSSTFNIVVNAANTCTDPAWSATATYTGGMKVSYNGRTYTANWWNQNTNPSTHSGAGQEWTDNGACGGSSNVAPTVSLTAPSNGSSYTAPASVTLTATASDSDGSISKVEFYSGTTLLGQGTLSSGVYSYTWSSVATGTYSLTAKATDNLNAATTSSVTSITVSNPSNPLPVVSITSPAAGASFNAPATVTITANATDNGSISKVEFYNGTTLLGLGTASGSVYTYNWTNVSIGSYSLTAKAYDNLNATATSSAKAITVVNPLPTVSLTSPANNASFTTVPATVSMTATASDNGSISKVEFYQGTTLLGQGTLSSGVYSYTWSNVAAGSYSITAKAYDNLNATSTSSAASITVGSSGCSAPQYVENGGYVAGSRVKNNGVQYECKPYPYTAWCNGAAWAYAPGTGSAWADAWTQIGACRMGKFAVEETTALDMYPNPASHDLNVNYVAEGSGEITVSIVNQLSTSVLIQNVNVVEGNNSINLNVSSLERGVYLIRIEDAGKITMKKLSVVK